MQSFFSLRKVSLVALVATIAFSATQAWAKTATLMGMEARTQDNQIVLYLSQPATAQTSMPVSPMTNEKTLVIDLDDVAVPKISNKEALLNAIKNALPDVSQITMSEFAGAKPMVRLAIKLMSPDIDARLFESANNELIIQLDKAQPMAYIEPVTVASFPQSPSSNYAVDTYNPDRPAIKTQAQIPGKTASGNYIPSVPEKVDTSMMRTARRDDNQPAEMPCDVPKKPYVATDRTDIYRTTMPMSYYNEYNQNVMGFQHTYPEVNTNDVGNDVATAYHPYKYGENGKSLEKTIPVKMPNFNTYQPDNRDSNLTGQGVINTVAARQNPITNQVAYATPSYGVSGAGPNSSMAYNNNQMGDRVQAAEKAYLLAIQSKPADADLYYNLANLYLDNKQFGSAVNQYQNALRYQPNMAEAYYQMGVAMAEQGDRSNAVQAMQNYLRLAPQASNRTQVQQFINALR